MKTQLLASVALVLLSAVPFVLAEEPSSPVSKSIGSFNGLFDAVSDEAADPFGEEEFDEEQGLALGHSYRGHRGYRGRGYRGRGYRGYRGRGYRGYRRHSSKSNKGGLASIKDDSQPIERFNEHPGGGGGIYHGKRHGNGHGHHRHHTHGSLDDSEDFDDEDSEDFDDEDSEDHVVSTE